MATSPTSVVSTVGPERDGQPMSFEEFAYAEAEPGYLYELERGIVVVDIPRLDHELVIQRIRDYLSQYRFAHRDRIFLISGGMGCVIRLPGMVSERHPDIAVYLNPPPPGDQHPWEHWCPDIVFEVVSKRSAKRDYEIKREEHLRTGVRHYIIGDPRTSDALSLMRRGDVWVEERLPPDGVLTTVLLPGFALPLADVFSTVWRPPESAPE